MEWDEFSTPQFYLSLASWEKDAHDKFLVAANIPLIHWSLPVQKKKRGVGLGPVHSPLAPSAMKERNGDLMFT